MMCTVCLVWNNFCTLVSLFSQYDVIHNIFPFSDWCSLRRRHCSDQSVPFIRSVNVLQNMHSVWGSVGNFMSSKHSRVYKSSTDDKERLLSVLVLIWTKKHIITGCASESALNFSQVLIILWGALHCNKKLLVQFGNIWSAWGSYFSEHLPRNYFQESRAAKKGVIIKMNSSFQTWSRLFQLA